MINRDNIYKDTQYDTSCQQITIHVINYKKTVELNIRMHLFKVVLLSFNFVLIGYCNFSVLFVMKLIISVSVIVQVLSAY